MGQTSATPPSERLVENKKITEITKIPCLSALFRPESKYENRRGVNTLVALLLLCHEKWDVRGGVALNIPVSLEILIFPSPSHGTCLKSFHSGVS